ncbi:lasso peptide biosynthesis B2 protein [Sphingobium chungangianum]
MERFSLRPGISHHSFGDGAIVLDIHRDRYWRVGRGAAFVLDWICGTRAGAAHPDAIEQLCRLGLIERSREAAEPRRPALPRGRSSAIEQPDRRDRVRLADLAEVAALLVAARHTVRRAGIRKVVDEVRHARARRCPALGDLDLLARRFHASRGLLPLTAKCLPDTLAFVRYAARRGHFPDFVFGVVPVPFAAHCWSQSGDRVLNDAVGHTRAFAPILIL